MLPPQSNVTQMFFDCNLPVISSLVVKSDFESYNFLSCKLLFAFLVGFLFPAAFIYLLDTVMILILYNYGIQMVESSLVVE